MSTCARPRGTSSVPVVQAECTPGCAVTGDASAPRGSRSDQPGSTDLARSFGKLSVGTVRVRARVSSGPSGARSNQAWVASSMRLRGFGCFGSPICSRSGEVTNAATTCADAALSMLDVDKIGFDIMDRKLLEAVLSKFGGGPVGLDNLAAAIGEERDTIEDVLEPYLIQQGYLMRTPRGRIATPLAYEHFGLTAPSNGVSRELWDSAQ